VSGDRDQLEITVGVIGRQVEQIMAHLGLATDEDGGPLPPAWLPPVYPSWPNGMPRPYVPEPFAPPALDQPVPPQADRTSELIIRGLERVIADIREIAGDTLLADAQAGARIRAYLYPADSCGHEPEGREIALAPGSVDGDFPPGDIEMTAVYRYARSDRDYPSGMPEDQWPAEDLRRAPDVMRRAIDADQADYRVRDVTP